jgi:hypothetical protein
VCLYGKVIDYTRVILSMCLDIYKTTYLWRGASLSTGCVFIAWYLVKHRDDFTFILSLVILWRLVLLLLLLLLLLLFVVIEP